MAVRLFSQFSCKFSVVQSVSVGFRSFLRVSGNFSQLDLTLPNRSSPPSPPPVHTPHAQNEMFLFSLGTGP